MIFIDVVLFCYFYWLIITAKEARTETQHVEYENPLLKKLTSQPESRASIDMVTSEGPEASKKDEVKEEKPVAGTDRSKKTFFKSKNKTDPAAAKAKAVSRYKLFNFTGEDEEFGPGGDQESSVPEAFTKKDDGYSVTDKDLFEGDFAEPENKQVKTEHSRNLLFSWEFIKKTPRKKIKLLFEVVIRLSSSVLLSSRTSFLALYML